MQETKHLSLPNRILAAFLALVLATSMAVFPGASIASAQTNEAEAQQGATLLSTSKIGVLTDNLLARFAAIDSDDLANLGNDYAVAAMALAASGKASSIDIDALKARCTDSATAGALGKIILGLTAAGVNCQAVSINGKTVNLISRMEAGIASNQYLSAYDHVWILPVYAKYAGTASVKDQILEDLLDTQVASGECSGLFDGGWGADVQTTAQAICALSLFPSEPGVQEAIEAGLAAIKAYQQADGGFRYDNGEYSTDSSIDTTGAVVAAFLACGMDPDDVQVSGCSALDFLQSQASADLTKFEANLWNESLSAATALLGLSGITGYAKNNQGNVYKQALSKPFNLAASPISISTSTKTYTGKALTTSVSIAGLTKGTDYKVAYKNNVKVGTATVTVTGTGNFTGSVSKTFTIRPKGTTVKKLTKKDNALGVTITKRTTQVTGYQVMYSTSKSFKTYKTKTTKNDTTTKVTLSKLKNKKTYYVKVRTYATVNGKKIYSAWSAVKSAKTL